MEDAPERADASVRAVCLESFRNYDRLDLELSSGFNVLAGENAQGKTNFLEALYLASTARLLRGQKDSEAIREGSDRAAVSVEIQPQGTKIGISLERGARKRATLNGLGLPRAADVIGRLPCVCVSSADMAIVRGEPSDRRLFLDLELSGLYPAYLRHLTLYKRALEQRNALLRDSREGMRPCEQFEPWEEQMAHHGIALRNVRLEFLDRLSPASTRYHAHIGAGESISVGYVRRDDAQTEEELRLALQGSRDVDVYRGGTSPGPHRDDLSLDVGGRDCRLFGSQGQQRTSVIAVKLATLEIGREELGAPPLLLLDDILSDLDERRRGLLVEVALEHAGQAVLTCTEASAAGERILQDAAVYHVEGGTVRAA